MEKMIEKLCAQRTNEAPAKPDYAGLMDAIFGKREEPFDAALNDNAEFKEAVEKALSTLNKLNRYCVEERYLHGKSLEQLADEFRKNMDMEKFADKLIKKTYKLIRGEFMENIEMIFTEMEGNTFRELEYRNGVHPDGLPKNDTYYEPNADKTVLDILRNTLECFDSYIFSYREFFEKRYIQGQSIEELAQWLSENMAGYIDYICTEALRRIRHPSVCRSLKRFIAGDDCAENNSYYNGKCGNCIYELIRNSDTPTECGECKTAEAKEWMKQAISELPTEEQQVIRELYDFEEGYCLPVLRKDVAVKLRIDSKERVAELEKSARRALKSKALRFRFK